MFSCYHNLSIKVSITFICNQYVNVYRLQSSHHPVFSYTMIFKSSGPTLIVTSTYSSVVALVKVYEYQSYPHSKSSSKDGLIHSVFYSVIYFVKSVLGLLVSIRTKRRKYRVIWSKIRIV